MRELLVGEDFIIVRDYIRQTFRRYVRHASTILTAILALNRDKPKNRDRVFLPRMSYGM